MVLPESHILIILSDITMVQINLIFFLIILDFQCTCNNFALKNKNILLIIKPVI